MGKIMFDEDVKIKIVRSAIASKAGWEALAKSVIYGEDSEFNMKECLRVFKIIADDSYNSEEWFDILSRELSKNITRVTLGSK